MEATGTKWQTKSGFEILFRKHYSVLCAYAYGFVADYGLSEDIVQEVFFKLWTDKGRIAIETSVKAYLYQMVRNTSLNYLKHKNVIKQYEIANKDESNYIGESLDELLIGKELNAKIQAAIEKLPTERRKVFLLSRMDGLKYKEIAEKLNISIKTVENQMGKALSTLRTELAGESPLVLFALFYRARTINKQTLHNQKCE
ncbi:DNA-directed RNA polymerase sigma-70 factor [Prolixibacter bellariivorans]|uniref:DNA-directed RNA polymerase sigma-70 factor n=1 Tax=Prolixibacter bellariivorans TaxID=314319 RepID=A0A5M4B426_9BACT|nr:RNA polymerase sigma-70 factor [Prolixibacter bellariivorans]GET34905.1 DNA-directed RNA polymerase sigma-70 factor [Prolixibacter bellariivorans]